jgi:hypothetical protein
MDCELVNRCAVDPNTITNPSTNGWSTTQKNNAPTRNDTVIQIPDFEYSNADCPWILYELLNHESNYIKVVDKTLVYSTAIKEPKQLTFTLRVTAMGGTRFKDFPTTLTIEGCDNEANVITNPSETAWKLVRTNENPSRGLTSITIGSFTYSNPYCKWWKYTVNGADATHITISSNVLRYKTNFVEPRTLNFNLKVHAYGDTWNGASHNKDFASSIKIQGCDNEGNSITNPGNSAWNPNVVNETPTRQNTNIAFGSFSFSNPYCKFLKYTISGTNANEITLDNPNKITYRTNYVEPKTLNFILTVHA